MPVKKKSHSFVALVGPGKCCEDLERVLDLEDLPEKGHMLGVIDDVIFMSVFNDDHVTVEEPVLYCFCCGKQLAESRREQSAH